MEGGQWKSLVPILYNWFSNHNLVRLSLCCRWGPQLKRATHRQILYLSERANGMYPHALVVATVEEKPQVAEVEQIEEVMENACSLSIKKAIIHPGEVNRIKELPQNKNIVATHTDSPKVLIWNVKSQPKCQRVPDAKPSSPDLILKGHKADAQFALSMCPMDPLVLSGGKDHCVVLWNIQDHISSLAGSESVSARDRCTHGSTVRARKVFRGHKNPVEEVQFNPSSGQEFCSVGDDSFLMLWDARAGSSPVVKVKGPHNAAINCVDWNSFDTNLILTGSADNSVQLFDRRNLTSGAIGTPVHTFKDHTAPLLYVQWCPHKASVFGSSGVDGILNVWDFEKVGAARPNLYIPPGLIFQHLGQRGKLLDFHWNPLEPWTVVSVAKDGGQTGGGILQMWQMFDYPLDT